MLNKLIVLKLNSSYVEENNCFLELQQLVIIRGKLGQALSSAKYRKKYIYIIKIRGRLI